MNHRAIALSIVAFFVFSGTSGLPAQEAGNSQADASAEDFEAALFGDDASPEGAGPSDGSLSEDSIFNLAEDEDPVGYSDSALEGNEAATDYLIGGSALIESSASRGNGNTASEIEASGKLFAKVTVPDYGSLFVSYVLSHFLFQGYDGDPSPEADDPYEIEYSLSEFHYSFDIGKRLFIRIGNQLIAWGPSRIWSPVDFINLEKQDAFADLDVRVGKPGLRLHVPMRRSNAFLFADFSAMVDDDGRIADPLKGVSLGGRFDFTAGPFEFGFSGYGGIDTQLRFGADFSGRAFGTSLYGELAYAPAYEDFDESLLASLGFSRVLGDLKRITLSAESFYTSRPQSSVPLYQGAFYGYLALKADKFLSQYLATTLYGLANLDDFSYTLTLSESIELPRAVPFTVELSYAGGGEGKEFTGFAGNNSFSFKLSTKIEF